jgi:hypothetical protein
MRFFRKDKGLPMQGSKHGLDGSGRAIHMDAPLWRAWKNSNGYIKGSYILLVVSFVLMFSGYRYIRHNNGELNDCIVASACAYSLTRISIASVWLTCHAEECTLEITPPGRGGGVALDFARRQLIEAKAIKVDSEGKFVKLDDAADPFLSYRNKQKKGYKKHTKYKSDYTGGPDSEGYYDSYHLVLQPGKSDVDDKEDENKEGEEDDDDKVEDSNFDAIKDYTSLDDEGRLVISMRRFNLGQTRRRTRTLVNKVDAYVKQRRHMLVMKENSSLSVWGILQLVVGLFMFLLTILLGLFIEEPKPRRHGGPGARRQSAPAKSSSLKYRASAAGVRQQTTTRKNY